MKEVSREGETTAGQSSSLRRIPNQRRSRERVENILNCAVALITESGSDAMRMSELAQSAGVSIGSLYQYFPDKGAIIQTLAERYNTQSRACIEAAFADVGTADELQDAFGALIDEYYEIFLADPVMRDIWSGTQADKALRDIELSDSRANAAILARVLTRVGVSAGEEELAATAFVIMHLGEASMRLAISVERAEGRFLVDAYKRMARAELRRIVDVGMNKAPSG